MPITLEHLKTHLSELRVQENQLRQQLVATLGAIADVQYWLTQLETEESPKEPNE